MSTLVDLPAPMTRTFFKAANDTIAAVPHATPRFVLGVVLLAMGVACKHAPMSGAAQPDDGEVPDDIARIEDALARNADALQSAGIVVAQRNESLDKDRVVEDEQPAEGGEAEPVEETEAPASETPSVSPAPPAPEPSTGGSKRWPTRERTRRIERRRDREDDRCQRICDLAEATCGLADRICELASRHPDEVRYAVACERADAQCEAAADACTACSG
jgi:hypothetical protein